jgi:dihydrofolate reductase
VAREKFSKQILVVEIILAVNKSGYIGLNNKLPWKSKDDLNHFKKLTMGKTCLVGRKTYEDMPKLSGRNLIVVGNGHCSLEDALKQDIDYVIGGKHLIESTMHLCSKVHLSVINDWTVGDVRMPSFKEYVNEIRIYRFEINNL